MYNGRKEFSGHRRANSLDQSNINKKNNNYGLSINNPSHLSQVDNKRLLKGRSIQKDERNYQNNIYNIYNNNYNLPRNKDYSSYNYIGNEMFYIQKAISNNTNVNSYINNYDKKNIVFPASQNNTSNIQKNDKNYFNKKNNLNQQNQFQRNKNNVDKNLFESYHLNNFKEKELYQNYTNNLNSNIIKQNPITINNHFSQSYSNQNNMNQLPNYIINNQPYNNLNPNQNINNIAPSNFEIQNKNYFQQYPNSYIQKSNTQINSQPIIQPHLPTNGGTNYQNNLPFNFQFNIPNNIQNFALQNVQTNIPINPNVLISPSKYYFSKKGLVNIGSTCYMNATLQCLLHVNELIAYFLDEYPKDKTNLNNINKNIRTKGEISNAFYNLVVGVYDNKKQKANTVVLNRFNYFNVFSDLNAFSPDEFKRTLGYYNSQFKNFEANDSRDLILYLLQSMHEELNYFGNKNLKFNLPNQYNCFETYNIFNMEYNSNNFSKISVLFYGTYINTTICQVCKQILYNFQKFEFISFALFYYNNKKFNIYDGFRDNNKPSLLTGENLNFCNICKKLQEAESIVRIFEPPNKLLINLDYGKNKKYQPSKIEFDEEIDITEFVVFDYKQRIRYRIFGVCTHYGYSGSSGHYKAFCRNKENKWYVFNDSSCGECSKNDIYGGSPYLLLYERIYE